MGGWCLHRSFSHFFRMCVVQMIDRYIGSTVPFVLPLGNIRNRPVPAVCIKREPAIPAGAVSLSFA